MDLSFFKEFLVLSEKKNYTEAADILAVSESSLSRHIKSIEDELGVSLFERTSRSIKLTDYGRIFLPYAQQMSSLEARCINDIKKEKINKKNTVTIATGYYVGDLLTKFYLDHPEITISVLNCGDSPDEITNLMRCNMCDIGFVTDFEDKANEFNISLFDTDSYVLILPESHPLAKRKSIALSEIAEEPFISFKSNSYSEMTTKQLFRDCEFQPRTVLFADVGSSIAAFVSRGLGISILQQKTLKKMSMSGIVQVPISPPVNFDISVCNLKNHHLSKAAKCFYDYSITTWQNEKIKL